MAEGTGITVLLVDTTVWVDFFAGRETSQVRRLETSLSTEEDICTCGVILTEVLQGIREDVDYERTRSLFNSFLFLPMNHRTFVKAAGLYRSLRRKGITIRKPVDCMIAAVALQHDISLLHNDRDFDRMEQCYGLKVAKVAKVGWKPGT